MSDQDPFDELFGRASSMDPDELAMELRGLCKNLSELEERAFEFARFVPAQQRDIYLDALELAPERRVRLGNMIERDAAATPSRSELRPDERSSRIAHGTLINDRYEIRELLGRGGMGAVYQAYDVKLKRLVAIKFLLDRFDRGDPELASRFMREARATAQCKHENIVAIHDVDEYRSSPDDTVGVAFMVLEYLDGETLRRTLAGMVATERATERSSEREQAPPDHAPAMSVRQALDLIIPVVRALVCAHQHDIVHRDLKPENIFITRSGTIKVLDFGIAKVINWSIGDHVDAAALTQEDMRTRHGTWLGTARYMSPEQWDVGEVDQRTDLWAVGVILYEMLTGEHPVSAVSLDELRQEICDLERPMPGLEGSSHDIDGLGTLVDQCLRKKKSERMARASELLAALEAIRENLVMEARPSPWLRRVGLGLAALVLLSAGLFTMTRMTCNECPRLEIPVPPDHTRGVVVAVLKDADTATKNIQDSLCQELRERSPLATICIEIPDRCIDDTTLVRAASEAAALVLRVENGNAVRFLPIIDEEAAALFERSGLAAIWMGLPSVKASSDDIQEQVAAVAVALSRVLAGEDISAVHFDIAPARVDEVGWRFAALTWGLGLISGKQYVLDHSDTAVAMQKCTQDADSLADWYCAAAHYAYTASCETCDDRDTVLEGLADRGADPFQNMARLVLSRQNCTRGQIAHAVQRLLELDGAWAVHSCERMALVGTAMCVLSQGDGLLDEPTRARMQRFTEIDELDSCDETGRALVFSDRAMWHYRDGHWRQAGDDWYQAWKLDSRRKVYLLNWAEALLRQRGERIDVAERIGHELDPLHFEADQRARAIFLRWVATRHRDDASALYELYQTAADGTSVLRSDQVERALCDEPDDATVCRVYDIITVSKRGTGSDTLHGLLFGTGRNEQ